MERRGVIAEIEMVKNAGASAHAELGVQPREKSLVVERPSKWKPRQIVRRLMSALISRKLLIVNGRPDSGAVYLTFDDGPNPEFTPQVLDVLKAHNAKATFFVTGQNCAAYPELVRRIREEGHCLGHHSFSHSEPLSTSAKQLLKEAAETDKAFVAAGVGPQKYYRPPHGKLTLAKLVGLWRQGHTVVLWNRDSKDYEAKSTEQITEWAAAHPLESGDVLLLHDRNPYTPKALAQLIEGARSKGLYLDTIADLISPAAKAEASALDNVVCFAKDWEECPTSNNHVMSEVAKTRRVLWLNSIATRTPNLSSGRDLKKITRKIRSFAAGPKRVRENMWVYTPLVLPLPHSKIAKKINERLLRLTVGWLARRLGMKKFQLWSFLPNAAEYVGKLGESLVVYYCVDDWAKFNYLDGERIAQEERRLVKSADIVFASAQSLVSDRLPLNPETHLARHGVDHALFSAALNEKTPVPEDVAKLPKPLLGFYGTLQDWVDYDLVRYLAERHPDWSIALIGPVLADVSSIAGLHNVHMLGRREHASLPGYCKAFSVGIIPYRIDDRILHVNPLKMREYLSAGVPVVSTAIPELRDYIQYCAIAHTPEEFEQAVERAIREDSLESRRERSNAMLEETWERATARVMNEVRRVFENKGIKR